MHAWRPAFLGYPDALGYVDAAGLAHSRLVFWNPYRPAGYPIFLSWLHAIDSRLAFAIGVQHLMGLAVALLLYLTVARFARRRWVGLLPAAVVALSGSELYLEHAALSETLYTFLVVAAMWCAARSYDSGDIRQVRWLAAAGLLIGACGPVRPVGVLLVPVLIGWAAATRSGGGWRYRLRGAAIVGVGVAVTLGSYLVIQYADTGTWGLTRTTGETLYARAAIFADCSDFTPPTGTRGLCQPSSASRYGATWYMFSSSSPAQRIFGAPPDPRARGDYNWPADSKLEAFALAAITHQPWQYAWTTIQGLVKYVDPTLGTDTMLEWSHSSLISELRNRQIEAQAAPLLAVYSPGEPVVHHSMRALDDYAQAARVEGPVTAALLILMLAGFVLARNRRRAALGLLGWTTTVMLLAPVALLFYGARYATPAYGPLAAAAALGLDEVIAFAGRHRHRRTSTTANKTGPA